jgi:hypothetical protein
MVSSADGYLWCGDTASGIWRISTSGQVQSTSVGIGGPYVAKAASPDGKMWFLQESSGRTLFSIDSSLNVTSYSVGSNNTGLTYASDGGLWFVEKSVLARVDEKTGEMTTYSLKTSIDAVDIVQADPSDLAISTITSKLVTFDMKSHKVVYAQFIPNGLDVFHGREDRNLPTMTLGPDFNLWLQDGSSNQNIAVCTIRVLTVKRATVTLSVGGQQALSVSEMQYMKPSFTATSSNPDVASVPSGSSPSKFNVTGTGTGSCSITISDTRGNSTSIPVTVN